MLTMLPCVLTACTFFFVPAWSSVLHGPTIKDSSIEATEIVLPFAEKHAGRAMLLVGDSLSVDLMVAFVAALGLKIDDLPVDVTYYQKMDGASWNEATTSYDRHDKAGLGDGNTYGVEVRTVVPLPSGQNIIVARLRFYKMQSEGREWKALDMSPEVLRHVVSKYHVVVANLGAHFQRWEEKDLAESVDGILEAFRPDPTRGTSVDVACPRIFVFREVMPAHFPGVNGEWVNRTWGPKCIQGDVERITAAQRWRNDLIRERVESFQQHSGVEVAVQEAFAPMMPQWMHHKDGDITAKLAKMEESRRKNEKKTGKKSKHHNPRHYQVDCLHFHPTPKVHLPVLQSMVAAVSEREQRSCGQ